MPKYDIKVLVQYNYQVEANSYEEAEAEGWKYEDYKYFGEVYSIDIDETEVDYDEGDEE